VRAVGVEFAGVAGDAGEEGVAAFAVVSHECWGIVTDVTKQLLQCQSVFEMNVTFSQNLARLMKEMGFNQSELARRAGLSHVAIANYLAGRVPKYEAAEKLSAVFGVNTDYLLNPDRYKSPFEAATSAFDRAEGSLKEREVVYQDTLKKETQKLKARSEGYNEAEALMRVDLEGWKKRALAAEGKLANMRVKIGAVLNEL